MTGPDRHVRLLVTIVLGAAENEVALERVSIVDDDVVFPNVPMLDRVLAEDRHLARLSDWERFRARKRLAQCLLMDQYEVPNGDKSIAIGLDRHWTPALHAIFGDPDSPSSIKRWRRVRGVAGRRRLNDMAPRRTGGKDGRV